MNDAEHDKRAVNRDEVERYLADLMICAAQLSANLVDLEVACMKRLAEKFPEMPTTVIADL